MLDFILEKQTVWDFLKNSSKPIIAYGMGNGAEKVFEQCHNHGIKIDAVIASDEFVRGQSFRGFKVERLSDIERRYNDIIIAVCFASSLPQVINRIIEISKRHTTVVPCVPVFGNEIFDMSYINKNQKDIKNAYNLMSDKKSRQVFAGMINFQISGKLKYLFEIETCKHEAFSNILKLASNEIYLDLGAYKGDTIDEFLHYTNSSYNKIIALEPNYKTFLKLEQYAERLSNTTLYNLGAWDKKASLKFNSKNGRNSASDINGNVEVDVISIDELLQNQNTTYIKMDIEGAEYKAINGASQTIKNYKPKLNIAAYHRSCDIFKLPNLINNINPKYKIYLRHHPYIPCWDTNLYCV